MFHTLYFYLSSVTLPCFLYSVPFSHTTSAMYTYTAGMPFCPLIEPSQPYAGVLGAKLYFSNTTSPYRLNMRNDFTDAIPVDLTINTSFTLSPSGVKALGINNWALLQNATMHKLAVSLQP